MFFLRFPLFNLSRIPGLSKMFKKYQCIYLIPTTSWYAYTSLPSANEVCEGYIFTPVCHSVHRRRGVSRAQAWAQVGVKAQAGRGVYSSMHWGRHPPPADGYCCGRYASYWNAFLLSLPLMAFHALWCQLQLSFRVATLTRMKCPVPRVLSPPPPRVFCTKIYIPQPMEEKIIINPL